MLQCLLSCSFNNSVTLPSTRLRLPEDDEDASKHAGVLMIYKILILYIYIYVCAFVVLDNKLNKMHSMYIKTFLMNLKPELYLSKDGNFNLQCKLQQAKCLIFGAHYKVTNTSLHICVPHTECLYVVSLTFILHY
jgi:hypothetical protein